MRYFFNQSSAGIFELEWHLFAFIFLLGSAYTLKHDKHVRVDLFYSRLSERHKAWVNLLGCLLFLMPMCFVIVITSFQFVENSFKFNESSPDPGGLPARFIVKSAIGIGFSLLFLQAISLSIRSFLKIFNHPIKP